MLAPSEPDEGECRTTHPWQQQHVEGLPSEKLQKGAGAEGARQADREYGHVIGRLSAAFLGRSVGRCEQCGPAGVEEVPTDTEENEGTGGRVWRSKR